MARNRLLKRRVRQLERSINREFGDVKNLEMFLLVALRDRRGELGEPYCVTSLPDDESMRAFVEEFLYLPEGEPGRASDQLALSVEQAIGELRLHPGVGRAARNWLEDALRHYREAVDG